MRILLIGANGQLAQDLLRFLTPDEVVPVTHQQLEICDARAVQALFDAARPNCVINTAAFHLVDDCEEQAEKAFAVNAAGVCHLARTAQDRKSTRLNSSHRCISYAVFCLKKK